MNKEEKWTKEGQTQVKDEVPWQRSNLGVDSDFPRPRRISSSQKSECQSPPLALSSLESLW